MSLIENKNLILNYIEKVWNQADLVNFRKLTTTTFTFSIRGEPAIERTLMEQYVQAMHAAFPDWRIEVIDLIAEDNRVVAHWHGKVTHLGSFKEIPPSGKHIHVSGINIYHIEDGKIISEWEQTDTLGMLQQMGLIPNRYQTKLQREAT